MRIRAVFTLIPVAILVVDSFSLPSAVHAQPPDIFSTTDKYNKAQEEAVRGWKSDMQGCLQGDRRNYSQCVAQAQKDYESRLFKLGATETNRFPDVYPPPRPLPPNPPTQGPTSPRVPRKALVPNSPRVTGGVSSFPAAQNPNGFLTGQVIIRTPGYGAGRQVITVTIRNTYTAETPPGPITDASLRDLYHRLSGKVTRVKPGFITPNGDQFTITTLYDKANTPYSVNIQISLGTSLRAVR